MSWTNAAITEAGHRLQAALLGTGKGLVFTRAVSGAGLAAGALEVQTAVMDERQVLTLEPAVPLEGAKARVRVLLSNTGLETGYIMHQLGFYAKAQDGGEEILYALVQDETGDPVPSAAESPGFSVDWTYAFAYGNAADVTVTIDPSGLISWGQVGQPNGVAGLDEQGKVPMSQLPELDFDAAGSAAAVQRQLEAHTGNRSNPHGVTAAQVGAFSKEQTLTAATAALVGLGADATPDQVFAKLKGLLDAAGSHADTKAQIEVKSYIGTGTYGVSNPCSLTFSFVPEVVLFLLRRRDDEIAPPSFYPQRMPIMVPSILDTSYGIGGSGFCVNSFYDSHGAKSKDGKTVYWYANSAANQLNPNGYEFIFVGIGK